MARYILIAVDSNEEADQVVDVVKERGLVYTDSLGRSAVAEVVGVFFKPTTFCECPRGLSTSRGKKYGANVHSCGKPIAGQWQHPRNLIKEEGNLYEQGLYLGIVEPQSAPMPTIDFLARGRALGITRR